MSRKLKKVRKGENIIFATLTRDIKCSVKCIYRLKVVTFIYHRLQGNQNSSSLQIEVAC